MVGVRFTELQSRPMEFLDFTSVTLDEFQQLVPPFETAFQCSMAVWRMDGKPRTARRLTVYQNCPLPTPEDRLLFMLTYVKTYALQVVQGRLFGMVQRSRVRPTGGFTSSCPRCWQRSAPLGMLLPAPSRLWHKGSCPSSLRVNTSGLPDDPHKSKKA